jgi:hypothetical protein
MKIEMIQQFFAKFSNIKFHEICLAVHEVIHMYRQAEALSKLNTHSTEL